MLTVHPDKRAGDAFYSRPSQSSLLRHPLSSQLCYFLRTPSNPILPGEADVSGDVPEFHQLKAAHDTLVDDYRRDIYDKFGEEGLAFIDEVKQNPQFGTVSQKMYTPEQVRSRSVASFWRLLPLSQLHYKLKKLHHETKRQWFHEHVQLTGMVEAQTSLESLKQLIQGEKKFPDVCQSLPSPRSFLLVIGSSSSI